MRIPPLYIEVNPKAVPHDYGFHDRDVEPILANMPWGARLTLVTGAYQCPGAQALTWVEALTVLEDPDLASVHVSYQHARAYGGTRQFWRHYRVSGEGLWEQVQWTKLTSEQQERVLDAYDIAALRNTWRSPGMSKSQRAFESRRVLDTFKLVGATTQADGSTRLHSIYNPAITYYLGLELHQRAQDGHRGGYYSYQVDDVDALIERFYSGAMFPGPVYHRTMDLVALRCRARGRVIPYGDGKIASAFLLPLEAAHAFTYSPASPVVFHGVPASGRAQPALPSPSRSV